MTDHSHPLLSIKDLVVSFKISDGTKGVVKGISFDIQKGESIGIVGESGSGKTMSMLAAARLLPSQAFISSGSIALNGRDLAELTDKEFGKNISGTRISMIFQEPMTALNPVYTIGRQLTETVLFHEKISYAEARLQAIEMLENVQLPEPAERMNQYPHQMSGGQRQRVMIAMALLNKPDLLIADEPTTALDVTVQSDIIQLLAELQKKLGMAMVFISHDLGVVSRVSQKIFVMCNGEIVESGPTQKVLTQPSHPYTKSLLACLWKLEDSSIAPEVSDTNKALIEISGVNKTFHFRPGMFRKPKQIVAAKDISFKVHSGETLAIVGESGSGKSTLARILNGLMAPDTGTINFFGKPISSYSSKERALLVQPIFQDPYSTLNPVHTIGYIVSRPLHIHGGHTPDKIKSRVLEILSEVGLSAEYYHRYPNQLSGGQRQRVAIARAIILNPKILICDEPTSALDVSIQEQVLDLLSNLQKKFGMTLILISHDMAVVGYLASRVFVMRNGKIVEQGPSKEVLKSPKTPYAKKLMDAVYQVPKPDSSKNGNLDGAH